MKYLGAERPAFFIKTFRSNTFDVFSMLPDFKKHLEAYFKILEKPMLADSSALPLVQHNHPERM